MKTFRKNTSCALPLSLLSILLVGAALNRLSPVTAHPVGDLPGVRWREIVSLFLLTPALSAVLWDLKRRVGLTGIWTMAFLMALILSAISMGIHEPTNALAGRVRQLPAEVMDPIRFWDETMSHAVFFLGFASVSLLLATGQLRAPRATPESRGAMVLITLSSLIMAGVIFCNMAFEPTRVDIAIGLLVLAGAVAFWFRHPRAPAHVPIAFHIVLGYGLGFSAALIYTL